MPCAATFNPTRVPERALAHCARHLREELKQFPNLQTVVILGEDAYQQFQRDILERHGDEIKPFEEILKPQGWARRTFPSPSPPHRDPARDLLSIIPLMGYNA